VRFQQEAVGGNAESRRCTSKKGIGGLRDVGIGGFLIEGFKVGIWNLFIGFFYWGFGFRISLWNLGFEYWILLLGFSFVGRLERLGRCLP